jgi:hypothetical protein
VSPEPLDPELQNGFGKYIILELFVFPLFPTAPFCTKFIKSARKKARNRFQDWTRFVAACNFDFYSNIESRALWTRIFTG